MLDSEMLEIDSTVGEIEVKLSNNLFEELGQNNYKFKLL